MEFNWGASSLMVGVKAAFNADPVSVSLIYMYGVSNESSVDSTIGPHTVTDPAFSWFELKGAYALNEAWSIYADLPRVQRGRAFFGGAWAVDDAGAPVLAWV